MTARVEERVQDLKPVRAPQGRKLSCRNWQIEAPFRMIQNNLDPDVAEDWKNLVIYGGSGRAARSWDSYHLILKTLRNLEKDETLLVQSGKPVAVFKTHDMAPRVLISNSMLVPKWATWEHFRELEERGLIMFGQMTAGSWIYIGTQGILQGTFETFMAAARKHFGAVDLAGRFLLSGGLGGMGGAQPLAATMGGGTILCVEVDEKRVDRRMETGYLDRKTRSLDEAIDLCSYAKQRKVPLSVGLIGNCAEVLPEIVQRGIVPDLVTDQTSAHDALQGYVPAGITLDRALELRRDNPQEHIRRSMESMATHCRAMLRLQEMGAIVFDYGNNLRGQASEAGVRNAFDYPGFVPAYIRPMFCEGRGPFRWVALSGDPKDIHVTDREVLRAFPKDDVLARWIPLAQEKVPFQGLPSRICWLGYGERAEFGKRINSLVKKRKISAPIVIGRDHLDCGSVASPNRETEGMKDGTDAVADWPMLNAMLNTSCGATWVSIHHGGGVGIGYSIHAGMVICADGTQKSETRLKRVLTADPGIGVARHADAGYDEAVSFAKKKRIKLPK